jgi:transposase
VFVFRFLAPDLVDRINAWPSLKRWERKEIGQGLRRMGLSYREIAAVIPVHKGTLSGWCADLELTPEQRTRLAAKRPAIVRQSEIGARRRMTARRNRELVRSEAAREAVTLLEDSKWTAGVVAYWSEGGKSKEVRFANSDPDLVRLFLEWSYEYLGVTINDLTIKLHLHSGQDERECMEYWSYETGIPLTRFRKTYVKPEGTGHRKNVLYAGTASVRVDKSGGMLQRILGWIDALRTYASSVGYTSAGR